MDDPVDEAARPVRPVRRRDRHGRAGRGPQVGTVPGVRRARPTPGARFDAVVLAVVSVVDAPWHAHLAALGELEYAVEEMPLLPDDWDDDVPLGSLVRARAGQPHRIVLFRRPLERRSESRTDLEELVRRVVAELLAELLGTTPDTVDPGYDPDA
ncbi:metallopeptidase family protein [Nocardioides sp. ChNu-99]|uniref:metallopeptidase family protein n=1 Tax=Nocardioides sp. ChNu-99 TaxID=2839897 RepID=UPI002404CF87|nr:metallopeptidase family protein [Nocardioides sp. ChNu-99]